MRMTDLQIKETVAKMNMATDLKAALLKQALVDNNPGARFVIYASWEEGDGIMNVTDLLSELSNLKTRYNGELESLRASRGRNGREVQARRLLGSRRLQHVSDLPEPRGARRED